MAFKQATVNASDVPATLTNYPAYVDLARLNGGTAMSTADADSIRVYSDSGKTTELAREIVSGSEMHVKIPSLTSTFTIYIDWDGVRSDYGVADTYGRNAVWSDYDAVYHMNQDPSGTAPQIIDSTGNGINLTSVGSMVSGDLVSGKIGDGLDFDGVNDAVRYTAGNALSGDSNFTVSAWFNNRDASNTNNGIAGNHDGLSIATLAWLMYLDTNETFRVAMATGSTAAAFDDWSSGISIATSTDYLGVLVKDGTTARTYVNGTAGTTAAVQVGATNSLALIGIGSYGTYNVSANYLNGIISEFRYCPLARSADWQTTEYNNQSDESGFWGTWTDAGGGGGGPARRVFVIG